MFSRDIAPVASIARMPNVMEVNPAFAIPSRVIGKLRTDQLRLRRQRIAVSTTPMRRTVQHRMRGKRSSPMGVAIELFKIDGQHRDGASPCAADRRDVRWRWSMASTLHRGRTIARRCRRCTAAGALDAGDGRTSAVVPGYDAGDWSAARRAEGHAARDRRQAERHRMLPIEHPDDGADGRPRRRRRLRAIIAAGPRNGATPTK